MSNKSAHPARNFSRFDAMSTEELNAILYQDSLLTSEAETDTDAILYIMEVIAKREATEYPETSPSAEEAWDKFNALYCAEDSDGKSLYEDDGEETMPILSAVPKPPLTEYEKPRKNIRFAIRATIVAAALCAFLLGSSLIASASGFDLWGSLIQWGREAFGFTDTTVDADQKRIYPEDNDPRNVLREHGVSATLLPLWMPDGYTFHSIESTASPTRRLFYIWYVNGTNEISMTIAVLSTTPILAHEKNSQDTEVYVKGGIEHYIVRNLEETTVAWAVGMYECSIGGQFSIEEAILIIDSIYGS